VTIVLLPWAADDVSRAARWYDRQRPGLGAEFGEQLDRLLDVIAREPLRFPAVHRETRRALLRRFPYALFFQGRRDVVLVVAVLHASRNPKRWRDRA